jgi:hypothetical protein
MKYKLCLSIFFILFVYLQLCFAQSAFHCSAITNLVDDSMHITLYYRANDYSNSPCKIGIMQLKSSPIIDYFLYFGVQ